MCGACSRPLPPEQRQFCSACRTALTSDPFPTCPRCASTVGPFVNLENGCNQCRDTRYHFERVLRMGPYEGLLRQVILRLKHSEGEGLAEIVGALWAEHGEARL